MRALRGRRVERVPVWLMRQAGRYQPSYRALRRRVSMLELCKNPALVAQVTARAVQDIDADAAILFSDLLLPAEPLGLFLSYEKGEGPALRPPVRSAKDVDRLKEVDVPDALGYVMEAVRQTRLALPTDIPLLGFAGAPFTLAAYLIEGGGSRDFALTKSFMTHEPKAWHRLLEKLARVVAELLIEQAKAGAQAVQLFDSWVGALGPSDYKTFVLPHSRAVFRALPKGLPSIHFGTQTATLLELLKQAGGDVIGLDWRVSLSEARRRLGDTPVMGNLDPALLMAPHPHIRGEVRRILKENRGRSGFVFNLGHGLLPQTPFENVVHLVECVKELG
ncbi:MAG: uroporphyrinogen decarboxylase [Elusimicrobia bacterium]|nr:uroporphyrinogen decarboxylase [Elusimicrobiota bacterium]MBK7545238.1 uroporphyrinogen decarboxylase [Elusimicrobiota bacterium]MBK8126904.1 uroporphyrinogen decarboxylase [Elusimicrobiota bacterium]MBK8650621.1 uroporphyrinogen decarboxylase [Elusimicrobiota bacterium]MBK9057828.1 uroporphyrinogen decarboxylase [Elusimicrobiota bacterium]